MRYALVMPAAGAGRRFGPTPKQYQPLSGHLTVMDVALALFIADSRCEHIAIALAADDPQRAALAARLPAKGRILDGGAERSHSVANALQALLAAGADPELWVLVHDAVRPCLSFRDLEALLITAGAAGGRGTTAGALLAAPVADTLKRSGADGRVTATQDRRELWRALTPQMFRLQALLHALQDAHAAQRVPTDDAEAMEWQGLHPALVPAQDANPKITTAEDLAIARAILTARLTARPGDRTAPT
jgi:2-C-methyl-D-erythritol 4-phosphate cytidylyltransferase